MATEEVLNQLRAQTALLTTIARQLETLAQTNAPLSPNYRRRLSEYSGFNWASINAQVIARNGGQVDEVEWQGHRFDRATGEKFDKQFVIFSRPAEGYTQTNKVYNTLIKFADYNDSQLDSTPPAAPRHATPPTQVIKPLDIYRTAPNPETPDPKPAVVDAPGFYNGVNALMKQGHKNIFALVGQVVADPGTDWGEKAVLLRQMVEA